MMRLAELKHIAGLAACFCCLAALAVVPDGAALKALLDRATAANYPNADTVTVYDCENTAYQRDGLYVDNSEFCSKALTEAGRKSLRQLSFPYSADYGVLTVEAARIVSPDGKTTELDVAKRAKVSISTGDMASNIFNPERKVLSLSVPELEIGDALCLKVKLVGTKTPFPGKFSSSFLLQDDVPILHAEVTIDAPAELPLRSISLKDKAGDTVKFLGEKRSGGRIVYSWVAADVPQLFPEPDMPRLSGVAQRLLVSTAKDWQEISRWYYELCRPRIGAVDDALREAVRKIVADKKSDEEKARALFLFVSQKIRYTGVMAEKQAPGFEPHDVKDTFRQRHGVCRDKAGLLVAMLNLAGLKAYPVLFAVRRPPVDDEVPASRFNHAIVAWEKAPGEYQLMDPTDESTREFLPVYLCNMSYLIAKPEGDVLRRSPSPPPEDNLMTVSTRAAYLPNGTLTGESVFDFTGYNDRAYRGWFSRNSPSVMRQVFSRALQRAIPGCMVDGLTVEPADVRDMSKKLRVTVKYHAPDLLPQTARVDLLPLPEVAREFGVMRYFLASASLDTRRHPLLFDTTCMAREEFELILPRQVRLVDFKAEDKGGGADAGFVWERSLKLDGNILRGRSAAAVTQLEISPKQYRLFRDQLRRWKLSGGAAPLFRRVFESDSDEELRRSFPDADSAVEYRNTTLELTDDGSFEIVTNTRRRILNYAGFKRHSEIKIDYNPHWETLNIEAAVFSPDGKRHDLDPAHVIDMDAGWVAAAPRYPGAKTKVAVLPGGAAGAVIESTITRTFRRRPFMSYGVMFAGKEPVSFSKFEMRAPARSRMRISLPPAGVRCRSTRHGGVVRYIWEDEARRPLPDELAAAPSWLFAPGVWISNGDYRTYAAALDGVCRKLAGAASKRVDAVAASLELAGGERDKAIKIRDFTAKSLRSAGPPLNELPFEYLTPPERTFDDGYGNSADRAIAIAALLERAGIEYRFVARSPFAFIPESDRHFSEYPQLIFTGLLVYIPSLGVYLNDTDQYAALGATSNSGMIGLELSNGKLIAIRPHHRFEDEERTDIRITINPGRSADIQVTNSYYGALFGSENRRYAEMTPEERRQHFETLVAEFAPEARPEGEVSTDFSSYPGKVSFKCRIEDFVAEAGGCLQFELPGFDSLARSLGAIEIKRETPYLRSRAVTKSIRYQISLPANWHVVRRNPERELLGKRNRAFYQADSAVKRGMLTINGKLKLPAELVQPQDYIELVRLQRDLKSLSRSHVVLAEEDKGGKRR